MFFRREWQIAALAVLLLLPGCADRGAVTLFPAAAALAPPLQVFVGTTRGPDPETGAAFAFARAAEVSFARYDVSVPPDRDPGKISYPPSWRDPDPRTDFLVASEQQYPSAAAFRTGLREALAQNGHEAVVYLHGYNNTLAEGMYRFAQLGHDLNIPAVLVHYSWPSRANVLAYAYDRDSALFARDGLESLLDELVAAGTQRIVLVAHSMGSVLAMETLRQMAIGGDQRTLRRLAGVVLISPDLDVDVFLAQARRIGHLPQPFIIFTSQRDRILMLSAKVSGRTERLGTLQDLSRVAGLDVTMVEVGNFGSALGHFSPGDSPALLALFTQGKDMLGALAGDQSGSAGLVPFVVLTMQSATRVVLAPVQAGAH